MIQVTSQQQETPKFPLLMRLKKEGGVFIFSDHKTAYCIDPAEAELWNAGEYYDQTDFDDFEPITHPITLQNV